MDVGGFPQHVQTDPERICLYRSWLAPAAYYWLTIHVRDSLAVGIGEPRDPRFFKSLLGYFHKKEQCRADIKSCQPSTGTLVCSKDLWSILLPVPSEESRSAELSRKSDPSRFRVSVFGSPISLSVSCLQLLWLCFVDVVNSSLGCNMSQHIILLRSYSPLPPFDVSNVTVWNFCICTSALYSRFVRALTQVWRINGNDALKLFSSLLQSSCAEVDGFLALTEAATAEFGQAFRYSDAFWTYWVDGKLGIRGRRVSDVVNLYRAVEVFERRILEVIHYQWAFEGENHF